MLFSMQLTIFDVFSFERYTFNILLFKEAFFTVYLKSFQWKKIEFESQIINKIKVFHQKSVNLERKNTLLTTFFIKKMGEM